MSRKNLDVRLVKSSLVATFGKATPPLIWRFDLERNHSFTLAMQGDDHEWELGVTSPKGEFTPVARFSTQEDADEALAALSAILTRTRCSWVPGFLKNLAIFILALLVVQVGMTELKKIMHSAPPAVAEVPDAPAVPPAPPPSSQNGVPLPADEVLKPPPP